MFCLCLRCSLLFHGAPRVGLDGVVESSLSSIEGSLGTGVGVVERDGAVERKLGGSRFGYNFGSGGRGSDDSGHVFLHNLLAQVPEGL